ncbi:chemotaxis protein CheA [Oscillospiraceae bacterium]|nr:chemotaxis protein CheA [Oscillospiraceae bacterium]BDF76536.1 chemotaxis protein CheA [Oscillospiraceae bacterium]
MGSGNDSILDMYLYETNTLLEQLDSIVLAAERAAVFSPGDVNEIFRIMHTIKGSSAMMEYNSLMTVAHRIEDLFFIIREKGMEIVPEEHRGALFDLMFQAVDYFRGEMEKVEGEQPLCENIGTLIEKINSLIAKIQGQDGAGDAPAPGAEAPAQPEGPGRAAGGTPQAETPPAMDGAYPYLIQVYFDEGSGMENLRAFMLVSSIRDFCAEGDFTYDPAGVESQPETAEAIAERGFWLAFRSREDRDNAVHVVTGAGSVRTYQTVDREAQAPADAAPERKKPGAPQAKAPAGAQEPGHTRESLISVNLSKLDELMAVVGEIVITESMVTASPDLRGLKLDSFTKSARQLRKLTDELQDVSMSLRMVPVSATFQKMNRIVRDMGKKLGKRARLTLVGEDTEVDKTIVDSIGDPIMHIVRNSMDHGIEADEEARTAAGKDPVGEIVLSARHTGGEVIIEVKDDGQGVNCDAVLAKAVRAGLASPDVDYSHREILNFLLMPGFSTNTEVTEFSGRGVGMDVVKKNVEEVGGTVSISSEPGVGMTTTLKIPLTMAIMDGMEVAVGGSIFTIPINNIRQSFKVGAGDVIHDAARGEMLKCMDSFYPVLRVKELYSLEGGCDEIEDGIVLWLEAGECSYCLFVDELMGEQQVVVKPLPAYVNAFGIKERGITGCTILGDGNISIILDAANLYSLVR